MPITDILQRRYPPRKVLMLGDYRYESTYDIQISSEESDKLPISINERISVNINNEYGGLDMLKNKVNNRTAIPVDSVTANCGGTVVYIQINFPDVSYDHPFADAIQKLKTRGIVKGYEDGTFKPDQLISRAEFIKY